MGTNKQKFQILVCEDDRDVQEFLVHKLVTMGVADLKHSEIHTADDGISAYKLLCQSNYDLVITDFRMPGLDGLQLFNLLRNTSHPNQNIPVIFVSGYVEHLQSLYSRNDATNVFVVEKPLISERLEHSFRLLYAAQN